MTASRTISAIQASVAAATDAQIAQIVALVDAMPQRGEADKLVAPLRTRLAKLRPPRPVGFTRLLFTPIDPLIIAAADWRRGSPAIPRTALIPISGALLPLLPAEAAMIEQAGPPVTFTPTRLTEIAASLWPKAAVLLETMPAPASWIDATGLPESDYGPVATALTAVLGVAAEIQALVLLQAALSDDAVRSILGRTAPRGSAALSAVVVVLLARLSGTGRIISLATEAAGSNPPRAVDNAVEHTLDMLQIAIEADAAIGATVEQATHDAARVAGLLQEIEASAASRPERKRRIERVRRAADTLCRARFETALQDELLGKLDTLPENPDDDTVEALETSARGLRRLEANGRQLGSGERYDALLRGCLSPFQQMTSPLRLEDRVRLVEILLGAEKALSLMA